jgi:hypothetical protein
VSFQPHQIFSLPARLSLPKGNQQGFPLQFLVVISHQQQESAPYGPVIPPQYQTYQQSEYQVVAPEDYTHQIQHQTGKESVKQTVEVVPENLSVQQQANNGILSILKT